MLTPLFNIMMLIIKLLLIHILTVIVHVGSMVIVGRLFKTQIDEIGLFTGPNLYSTSKGGVKFSLKLLPIGGFVKFTATPEPFEDDSTPPKKLNKGEYLFEQLSAFKKIIITLSGCLMLTIIGLLALGLMPTCESILLGIKQILLGALSFNTAHQLINLIAQYLANASLITIWGLVATKEVAFNLLPLTVLNGGQALIYLFEGLITPLPLNVKNKLAMFSLIICLCIFLSWAISFIKLG